MNVVPAAVTVTVERRRSIGLLQAPSCFGHPAKHAARKTKNVARLTKPERDQWGVVDGEWCAGRLFFSFVLPRNVLAIVLAV
jgi:hypothetical protein